MSTQVVSYVDLRSTIDNNPPVYNFISAKEEIESLKDQIFQARFEKSFSDTGTVKHFDYDPSESSVDPSRQSSRQDSRNASRSSGTKTKGKSKPDGRELSNISAASIEHKPSRSKSTLHTVIEDSFDDVFDLKDEAAWANVLSPDVPGRFKQYRKLSQSYINDLEEKLQVTLARMHRKVQTLKGQFQDHKTKWDTERNILMDQVNQSQTLQKDAEIEADSTINQLENFITEQEKLEQEEAKKRQQLALSANLLSKVVPSEPTVEETSAIPTEDEIQKLMQQTDDAKALASSTEDGADIKTPDIKQILSPGSSLPPIQHNVIKTLKLMMADPDEKLPSYQLKILESVRLALKSLNSAKLDLGVDELLRSVTVVSLASQLTHESMQLGVRPDSLFKTLANLSKRLLDEKENELRHLFDSTIDDGFSELSFESGTEGEMSIASLRDLPSLDDFSSDKDVQTETVHINNDMSTQYNEDVSVKDIHLEDGTQTEDKDSVVEEVSAEEQSARMSTPRSAGSTLQSHHESADDSTLEESKDDSDDTKNNNDDDADDSQSSRSSSHRSFRNKKTNSVSDRSYTSNSPISDVSDYRHHQSRASQTDSSNLTSVQQSLLVAKFSEDDDLRSSSARSRQSLRSQYRSKIEESKKVAGQRKNKSEALSVSIQEVYNNKEKILDDDPDDYLQSFGYSANGELLPEHPVVQEYLKTYNIGISFKDAVTKTLIDKDMMSASQLLTELEIHKFKQNNKVLPQLEKMTRNMNMVLGEIISLLNGILVSDRDAALSGTMGMSREPTLMTPESGRTPLPTRESFINQGVDNVDNEYVRNLQHQCHLLNKHLDNTTKKHEDQQQHNTVVMMEMQDTINSLQRELSTLGKAPRSATPRVQYNGVVSPETSVMFTRLDAERNAKIMKKAVNDDKLDQNKYKEAVSQMESYISLPAQRLAHIVRKYTHHTRMKYIEDTVQRSRNLDEDVFEILDKMEDLQKQRAKRWAETMDTMGSERLRMASLLMETLDNIENESGIFLIKPMYSYRGRDTQQKYNGKLSRPTKARRNKSAVTDNQSTYGPVNTPAYTPASNIRNIQRDVILQEPNMVPTTKGVAISTEPGVAGAAVNWVGTSSKTTWNMSASQSRPFKEEASFQNTPRILELDINRMLIGQNNISSRLSYPITDDRLVNASQNTLRTYVTINRPAVHPKSMDRPQSASGVKDSSAPPSTPQHISSAGVRRNDNLSPKLPSTPPLPPINKHRNSSALSKSQSSSTDNSQIKANRVNSGFTGTTSDED